MESLHPLGDWFKIVYAPGWATTQMQIVKNRCPTCRRKGWPSVARENQFFCGNCMTYFVPKLWTIGNQDNETDNVSRRFAGLEIEEDE